MILHSSQLQSLMKIDKDGNPQESAAPLRDDLPVCQILDFSAFRDKFQKRKDARGKARAYCLMFLQVMDAMILDYDQQMLCIAKQVDAVDWAKEYDCGPLEKIKEDVRLLQNLRASLRKAFEDRGAGTFEEACLSLNRFAGPEVISTLESFTSSDYFGFDAIRLLMETVRIHDEHCVIDFRSVAKIRRRFCQESYFHSTYRLAHLDWDKAATKS